MKILISAYACNPDWGSENYFGWAAVNCLARDHDLWVVTGGRNRAPMEKAVADGLVPKNVRFVYAGAFKEWHPHLLRARFQSWTEYRDFARAALPAARALRRTIQFDAAHHVTCATWRVAIPLWKLDVPFVLGPIGGYEKFPVRFLNILSPVAAMFELLRMASNTAARLSPAVRNCLRGAAHVFAANAETAQLAQTLRGLPGRRPPAWSGLRPGRPLEAGGPAAAVSLLAPAFHSEARIRDFSRFAETKDGAGPLRLFAAGMMEGRKGVAMALQALARVKKNGVKFFYRLSAPGPEIPHLKRLAGELDLRDEILFTNSLRGESYQRELGATHIYLLPSLRDSAPVTLTEAMLAGCVPIVAGDGGPGTMVTDGCGYKIRVTTREAMVRQMADVITAMDRDRNIIREKGRAAMARIAGEFSEEHYRRTVNAVYRKVTSDT